MSKQLLKNKLMELITGTKTSERKIICIDEDQYLGAEAYDDNTTVIVFVDFRARNEKLIEKQEIKSAH